jgi:hypothetical protein
MLMVVFVAAAPMAVLQEPSADEVQANRRRFEQLRKQPEQVAKLRDEAAAYFALSDERRRQLLQLHQSLHQETSATQARLHNVLERYMDWLGDLDEPTRKKIAAAPDKRKRLELIRELREQQWIKDQPKAIRDKIDKAQGDARKALIAKEKEGERQRRLEWVIASRFWNELESRRPLPAKFGDLPQAVQNYINSYLKLFLSPEENEQLKKAEGQWPQYPMKLVELASKHPAALPGALGPKSRAELPMDVFNRLKLPKKDGVVPPPKKDGRLIEGKWPEFGESLVKLAKQRGGVTFEHEFLAYNKDCLTKPMQDFMTNKLEPLLTDKEIYRLTNAIGHWPKYPETIQDLANRRGLQVPWFILPRVEDWDRYRVARLER